MSPFPSVLALLDTRQRVIEEEKNSTAEQTEETLQSTFESVKSLSQATFTFKTLFTPHKTCFGVSDGPPVPTTFISALKFLNLSEVINRDYNTLLHRDTWKYIPSD